MADPVFTPVTAADGTFSAAGAAAWAAGMTGSIVESNLTIADNTTGDVSIAMHGFAPKAPNDATKFLNGLGLYSVPAAPTPAYPLTITGGVSGAVVYASSTTQLAVSALLAQYGIVVGGGAGAAPATSSGLTFGGAAAGTGLAIAAGTSVTAGAYAQSITQTLNNAAATGGVIWTFTDTSSAAGFLPFQMFGGASGTTALFSVGKTGILKGSGGILQSGDQIYSTAGLKSDAYVVVGAATAAAILYFGTGTDMNVSRGGVNQLVFAGANVGGGGVATSRAEVNKNVTGIANNTATATLTVTIPNGAHSAGGKIIFKGAAGAGGAIGADEFTALVEYDWLVTRTAGVNAVATLSAALLTAITGSVAGGATPTITAVISAISGAVGATNTFTFNVTINALTGSSTNHTCFCYSNLLNDNASGVTIA